MSEYIDKEKLKTDFDDKAYYISHGRNNVERGMTLYGINQVIDEQQPVNVIEREEINKAIEELCEKVKNRGFLSCESDYIQREIRSIFKRNIGE